MTDKVKGPDCQHCSENCPFLEINYFEAAQKIPYHCALFDTFLAFDGQILRCSECLGQQRSIKEEGLNFINAYQGSDVNRSFTKVGFTKLLPHLQAQFVSFLKKFGHPVGIPNSMKLDVDKMQDALTTQLALSIHEVRNESKEVEELKLLLKKSSDDFPEMLDSKTCKFLMSLFSVLSKSEQDMLFQILRSPKTLAMFLQRLRLLPNDKTLLDNIRIELATLAPQIRLGHIPLVDEVTGQIIQPPQNQNY